MKALTLWQPWAELVASGAKRRETRSWATTYRGELAIHAARSPKITPRDVAVLRGIDTYGTILEARRPMAEALARSLELLESRQIAFGAIVAIVTLADVVPMTPELIAEQGLVETSLGDWQPGRFAWILEDVRRLETPIQIRGRQGLWTVPDAVAEDPGLLSRLEVDAAGKPTLIVKTPARPGDGR